MSNKTNILPGYKKTGIGIIPEEWEVKYLLDAAAGNKGNIIAGPFGSNLKVENYQENGIPLIRLQNIEENKFINKDIKYISEQKAKELQYHSFKRGDLVLAKLGDPIGKTCIIPSNIRYGIVVADVVRIRIDEHKADKLFIMYILNYKFCRKQLNTDIIGTTRPRVNINKIRYLQIPLPPLPEQRAIARILSDFDALIESLDRLIEKKKNIKKGAMQLLLTGKKRLPGFKGEWVRKKLGEILKYEQPTEYIVKSTAYFENGFVPVLTPGKTFILGYTNERDGIYKDVPAIIFDDFTTASKYVTFPFKVKSSAMKILKLRDESNDLKFVYEKMQLIDYQISEGDHKRRWIAEYQNIEIEIPPTVEEQRAIARILSDMDAEIEALEKKKKKYEMMKKGAMQLLLTGKIRLKEVNGKIEVLE